MRARVNDAPDSRIFSKSVARTSVMLCESPIYFYMIYSFLIFSLTVGFVHDTSGRSYVVGYGENPPKQPHHAASSCPDRPASCGWPNSDRDAPNPQILYGALVSGPDEADGFQDRREEYIYTEVTLDYNAGFTSTLAGLLQLQLQSIT